jgi:tetratricopeptide (TPR) repeat protein
MEARRFLEKAPPKPADGSKGGQFKKIAIQEEDEEDEEEVPPPKNDKKNEISGIIKVDKLIDTALLEEAKKKLQDKFKKAEAVKAEGNQLTKDGQFERAIKKFDEALIILNDIILTGGETDPSMDLKGQKASLLNNIGYSYAQMDMPSKVVEYCTLAIEISTQDEITVKAYLRRGNLSSYILTPSHRFRKTRQTRQSPPRLRSRQTSLPRKHASHRRSTQSPPTYPKRP